ncbi:MAG: sugar ABC transporter substrate-binding protein [Firmicutes bacterium]|nr:sugar ABC transporter substrate-binding protein [Bacillota bacterium]
MAYVRLFPGFTALVVGLLISVGVGAFAGIAHGQEREYEFKGQILTVHELEEGAQAQFDNLAYTPGRTPRVAYMPPATEFNYYMAIGEGIKAVAAETGVDTFTLAPLSGSDILTQMGMLQDVISQQVDAIILSTHDEFAAAPLVRRAVDQGIVVVIVNSDIPNFPSPVHAVVGYHQRAGTRKIGEYALNLVGDKPIKVGIIEGLPGYHSTERVGGFLDAIAGSSFQVVSSLDGKWNVEGGNAAAMDMLQAHPDIDLIFAANDYMIMGAARAAQTLGKHGLILLGNDGDTAALEEIAAGTITATVNTTPFVMGQITLHVVLDILNGKFAGGYVETPTVIVDQSNVMEYLCRPEELDPKPAQTYECG